MKKAVGLDIPMLLNGFEYDRELSNMKIAMKDYMDSRGMDIHSPEDKVNLVVVFFALFDVPRNEFEQFADRLTMVHSIVKDNEKDEETTLH